MTAQVKPAQGVSRSAAQAGDRNGRSPGVGPGVRVAEHSLLLTKVTAWLVGEPADHERFLEMNRRATTSASFGALVSLTQLIAAFTYGWPLIAVMISAIVIVVASARLSRSSAAPEVISAATLLALLGTNAAAATFSGGLSSPLLPLVLLSLLTQGVYFRAAVTTVCAALTAAAVTLLWPAAQLATWLAVSVTQIVPALPHGLSPQAATPAPAHLHLLALSTVIACSAAAARHLARSDADARGEAVLDTLTGAFNRRALDRHFTDVRARLTRSSQHSPVLADIGVVAMDIDHFKSINDRFGHERGDAVLLALSERLSGALRAGDVLYRTGGEEFLVLAPGAGPAACTRLAERLVQQVREQDIAGLAVTISAGVHSAPATSADLTALLRTADHALYDAKRAGRDRIALSTP